jgi:putative nucleotidyltransferase with HDIG domain
LRLIPIKEYDESSMELAKPVYDAQRRILLAANHTIHPKILERLIQMGIRTLVVDDAQSRGITMEEMLDIPTWIDVIQHVREIHETVRAKKPISIKNLLAGTGRLIMEVKKRPVLIPVPSATLPVELKPYAHAVNVTILSLQMGKGLNYNELMLRDLALGCLLHDIGKAVTEEELKHPEEGFQILRNIRELSLLSAHTAFQHHESLDGSGYPRGIKGSAFNEYAQICGLSNYYENLISNEQLPPHMAMEAVMARSDIGYSMAIVQSFVNGNPSYPPGMKVRLQTGEEAIVAKITGHMQRPVIRKQETGEEIDLSNHPTIIIAGQSSV